MNATTCTACSGGLNTEYANLTGLGVCMRCNGLISVRPLSVVELRDCIKLELPMQADCAREDMRYFDVVVTGLNPATTKVRLHGWIDAVSKRVVQVG